MKEGRLSSCGFGPTVTSGWLAVSSSTHLSIAPSRVISWLGVAPVAQFSSGPSCGQRTRGACRSEGLVCGQHVPERFGQLAGDRQRRDLAAAFAAVAGAGAFQGRRGGRGGGGGGGGVGQRPAAEGGGPFLPGAAAGLFCRLGGPRG